MVRLGSWLIFFGITFSLFGFKACFTSLNLIYSGVEGAGTVVDRLESERGEKTYYYLRLELSDTKKTRLNLDVKYPEYTGLKKGESVPILYHKDELTVFKRGDVKSVRSGLSSSIVMTLIGLGLLCAGLYLFLPAWRKPENLNLKPTGRINWFGYLVIGIGLWTTYASGKEAWYRYHYQEPVLVTHDHLVSGELPVHGRFSNLYLDISSAYAVYDDNSWEVQYMVLPYKGDPGDKDFTLVLKLSHGAMLHNLQNASREYHRTSALQRFWARQGGPKVVEFWLESPFETKLNEGVTPSTLYGLYDGPTSNLWPTFGVFLGLFLAVCGFYQRADKELLKEQLGEAASVMRPFVS